MKSQSEQLNWYQNVLNLITNEGTKLFKFSGNLACTSTQRNELVKTFQNHKSLVALHIHHIETDLAKMVSEILSKNSKINTLIFERTPIPVIQELFADPSAFKNIINIEVQTMDLKAITELFTKVKNCCKSLRSIYVNKASNEILLKVLEEMANGCNIDVFRLIEFPANFDQHVWLQALEKAKSIRHIYVPSNWAQELTAFRELTASKINFYEKTSSKPIIFPSNVKASDTTKKISPSPTKEKEPEISKKVSQDKKVETPVENSHLNSDEVSQLKAHNQYLKNENKFLRTALEEKTNEMTLLLSKLSPKILSFSGTATQSITNQIVKNSPVFSQAASQQQPQQGLQPLPTPPAFQPSIPKPLVPASHHPKAIPAQYLHNTFPVHETKPQLTHMQVPKAVETPVPAHMPPLANNSNNSSKPPIPPVLLQALLQQNKNPGQVPLSQTTMVVPPSRKTPSVMDLSNEQANKKQRLENGSVNHLNGHNHPPTVISTNATLSSSLVSASEAQLIKNLSSKK